MQNILVDKGIISQSGEICKNKISLISSAVVQPFAEMIWVTTNGDKETINRLTDVRHTWGGAYQYMQSAKRKKKHVINLADE